MKGKTEQKRIEQNRTEQNTKRAGTVVTYTLQPYLIFCAALMVMHLADPRFEQSAVSC
jgi:hypothetical protein